MKFMGYRRPDGTVGIRNHVLIMATVGCAAEVVKKASEGLTELFPLWDKMDAEKTEKICGARMKF